VTTSVFTKRERKREEKKASKVASIVFSFERKAVMQCTIN